MIEYKEFEHEEVMQLGLPRKGSKWLNIYTSEQCEVRGTLYTLDKDGNLDELVVSYSGNFMLNNNKTRDIEFFFNMHSEIVSDNQESSYE